MDEALVVGSGCGIWEEYSLGAAAVSAPAIIAVNLMTVMLPLVHHAISHHATVIVHLARARRAMASMIPYDTETHSSEYHAELGHVWRDLRDLGGDSGLLAVQIALRLGAERVVVVGVPLDQQGHFYDDPTTRTGGDDHTNYRALWRKVAPELAGRVFGVRGFLRDLLGPPPPLRRPRIVAAAIGGH